MSPPRKESSPQRVKAESFISSQASSSREIMGRGSELIEDYVTDKTFRKGLENLNFINEEYITKLKIIAMG